MTTVRNVHKAVKSKDSPFNIVLRNPDGTVVDSTGATRCDLNFKKEGAADVNISSSNNPTWFTLEQAAVIDGQDVTVVRVDLRQTTLAVGVYTVDVYLFNATDTNGRYRGTISVEIQVAPAAP